MEFAYVGIDNKSVKQKGKLDANNDREVIDFLRASGLTPLSVKKIERKTSIFAPAKVKNSDIVLFTRQLSSMTLTGLTLIESLQILRQQVGSAALAKLINDLIAQISEGSTFSDALASHKEAFSDLYIGLIRAAEKGGLLDKILSRLADNMEKADDLKKRVKSAMFYPAIVITGVVLVIAVMNIFVIPQLGVLYENLNLELPTSTKIVLGMSKIFTTFWPVLIFTPVGAAIAYGRFKKTEAGLKIIDRAKLRLPVFGNIIVLSILDDITRTLSLLVSSGTSIIEALDISANVAGNYHYKKAILDTAALVEKGVSLSDALENQKIFPQMVVQMTRVGESTGKIDESLLKISEYFERDLDIRIKTLTTAIEPILIIVLGVSVAFLILSVITPIYSLISQIQ